MENKDIDGAMNIREVVFSPTGGTRRVADALCRGLSPNQAAGVIDLCSPGFSADGAQVPSFSADDVAVVAAPVYMGRIPALAVSRLKSLKGGGAKCILVAVYGNRAFDDALVELQDVVTEAGFQVVAAVAAVAEHSIVRRFGAGRPDGEDVAQLEGFGQSIASGLQASASLSPLTLPGNRPYKVAGPGMVPQAGGACTGCGACATGCPAGAISPENLRRADGEKCISCMRCVARCPAGARSIGGGGVVGRIKMFLIGKVLQSHCSGRKPNQLFCAWN